MPLSPSAVTAAYVSPFMLKTSTPDAPASSVEPVSARLPAATGLAGSVRFTTWMPLSPSAATAAYVSPRILKMSTPCAPPRLRSSEPSSVTDAIGFVWFIWVPNIVTETGTDVCAME